MPNIFAYVVLFSYPLVVMVLFRRLQLPQALVWSIMTGYLFLPEQTFIDLPLLPAFDKVLIPSLTAAVMCWLTPPPMQSRRAGGATRRNTSERLTAHVKFIQKSWAANLCILVLFATPIGIALTNSDPVLAGPRMISGIQTYDIFAMMLNTGVMLLPFLLARAHLTTPESHIMLLRAFVISGLVYSVLILIEVRLSPQLNRWIYGFHAHSFSQHIRAGGYRPMLFIEHGLRVGLFMLLSVLAALVLYKVGRTETPSKQKRGTSGPKTTKSGIPLFVLLWLLLVLFLAKAVGAFIIACLFIPIILFTQARHWRVFAAALALAVLIYPMMRSVNLVPVEKIYTFSQSISAERAQSLKYRLDNEDILLDRASEKPLLGWGGWGRSRVYDPVSGRDLSVTDGTWVITYGVSGWLGYLAEFGLLTVPIFAFFFIRGPLAMSFATQGLCVMLTANLIDLIPNSGLTPVTWMLAGAILGRYEHRAKTVSQPTRPPRQKRHSRMGPVTADTAPTSGPVT